MADNESTLVPAAGQPPKLLDRLQARLAARGVGPDMQNRYREWCRQFIVFHGTRHPAELNAVQVAQFLEDLRRRRLSTEPTTPTKTIRSFLVEKSKAIFG